MADDDVKDSNGATDQPVVEESQSETVEVKAQPNPPTSSTSEASDETPDDFSAAAEPETATTVPIEPPPALEVPNNETTPAPAQPGAKKSASATLPILAAILTVILLVGIGVAAVKLNDSKEEENESTQQEQQTSEPVDQAELDQQLNEIDQVDKDLEQLETDLETNDITDENVGLYIQSFE